MATITTTGGPALDHPGRSLAASWWLIALRGVLGILFGIGTFALPLAALGALTFLFAAYLLVDGAFAIVAGVRAASHGQRWGLLILEGVAGLLAGAVTFAAPGLTLLVLINLIAAWAVVSGVFAVIAAFRLHAAHGRVWMGFAGVLSIAWGVLLFLFPAGGALVLAWWLGAYAFAFGISLLVLAFRLRAHRPA